MLSLPEDWDYTLSLKIGVLLRNISNHLYPQKTGAAAMITWLLRPFFFVYNTSIFDMKHTIAPSNVSSSVFKTSNTFSPG